jgi:hypothetical protein
MQERSISITRRFSSSGSPLSGLRIPWRQPRTFASYDLPERELVTALPGVADRASARVWRITLKPGQAEHLRFEGRSSILVESGKMTIQYVPGSVTEIVATGPNLPFVDKHGIPVESWVMETYQPPYLTRFQGLVRDSGDFGMVANDANEDLVAIVVERAGI